MRDNDERQMTVKRIDRFDNFCLGLDIQCAGRFIQDQNLWAMIKGAS
jgi:hypothetical protein